MNIKVIACLTSVVAGLFAGPSYGMTAAQRNVVQSARYDRLLETNMKFRQVRMRKECGPITDSQLRESCLESFAQYTPVAYGYKHHYRHHSYYHHCRCYHYRCCYHHSRYHALG